MRSFNLITGTIDLFNQQAPVQEWENAVARMMAGYYSKAGNEDTFKSTIQDIVQSLQGLHSSQNYPEELIYLKDHKTLEEEFKQLNAITVNMS